MKILFTGKGSAGSWKIRGEQLGNAVGEAIPNAPIEKIKEADLIVWVKRPIKLLDEIIKLDKPWVWDLVDFYPQPECSKWTRKESIAWVRSQINMYSPAGIIYPNKKMVEDICYSGFTLYHHHWPQARQVMVREKVEKIGYQGDEKYLGKWHLKIKSECVKRGWGFVINPKSLSEVDAVVGFRDGEHYGYAQKNWKSNVKITNAHAYGLPFIGLPDSGYTEVAHEFDQFVTDPNSLIEAFDKLTLEYRRFCNQSGQLYKLDLALCARDLRCYLETIQKRR